jgi:hypothetical protein
LKVRRKSMKRGRKAAMGRPIVHGGYSRLKSNLLKGQPRLRRYLEESRGRLIENLGGEDRLTCAQLILIDRAVGKLTVLRLMEARIAEVGAFGKDGELLPLLSKPYLRFADSLRKDLQALGIDRREDAGPMPWELDDDEENNHSGDA